jgi:hypothetical protein
VGVVSTEDLEGIVRSLSEEELTALRYFIKYRSVGEILATRELRVLGVKNPPKVLTKLSSLGLIRRGIGCYTVSEKLLEAVRSGRMRL